MELTGAQILLESLRREGVEVVFGFWALVLFAAHSAMHGLGAAVVMARRRKSAHDDTDAALMPRHAA